MADYTDMEIVHADAVALPVPDDVTAMRDLTPPTAILISPSPGAGLSHNQAVVIQVDDDLALAAVFVWVVYPGGDEELVYNGEQFALRYRSLSTVELYSVLSRRFTLRRVGGWPASPTVRIKPVDRGGNAP